MGRAISIHVVGLRGAIVTASVLASVTLAAPSVVLASGDANQASCPLETEASPGFRTYLPDCRAYELVTPPYKNGALLTQAAGSETVAADGNHLVVAFEGAFAGAGNSWLEANRNKEDDFVELVRSAGGWQSVPLTPSATRFPRSHLMAVSPPDLQTTLWGAASVKSGSLASTERNLENVYLRNAAGEFELVGPLVGPEVASEGLSSEEELSFAGASGDLSRSLFQIKVSSPSQQTSHHGHSDLWLGDTTKPEALSLYEYSYDGSPDREPTLVGVTNSGPLANDSEAHLISTCGTELGSGSGGSDFDAVSADGAAVFFTALHETPTAECLSPEPEINELYVRVDGEKTLAVSEPPLGGLDALPGRACTGVCAEDEEQTGGHHRSPAVFQGASEDGSKVFFSTDQPLVDSDTDTGDDLYEAEIGGAGSSPHLSALTQISHDSNPGEAAEVQGVVRISADGSHVYFVAKGKLTGEPREGGCLQELSKTEAEEEENTEEGRCRPKSGADNLYVYDADIHETRFVASLIAPAEEAALEGEESAEESEVEARAEHAFYGVFYEDLAKGESEEEAERAAFPTFIERLYELHGTLGPSGTLLEDHSLWQPRDLRPAQTTPDGRFLLFLASADLTAGDTSIVPQLFLYDAASESLTRVSIAQGGSASGNVDTFAAAPTIPAPAYASSDLPAAAQSGLAIAADGSRVFFQSAAGLVSQAEVGPTSVYEYRAGAVFLLSDGHDANLQGVEPSEPSVRFLGTDPSGGDAFFTEVDHLVPEAAGTQQTLYDAREAGGFPAPTLEPGCLGETCRGSVGAAHQSQSPESASEAGGGNLAPASSPPPVKPKARRKTKPCRRGLIRKGGKCVKRPGSKMRANAKRVGRKRRTSR